MKLDNLYPFAGDHAIQSAVFALEWASTPLQAGLAVEHLSEVRDAAKALTADFPISEDMQLMALQFPLGGFHSQNFQLQPQEFGGFTMTKPSTMTRQASRTIMVNRESCIVQINDYSRWDTVKADLDKYLAVLLPTIGKYKPVAAIGLQFNDIFSWKADPADLDLKSVFRPDTRWLPEHVFETSHLWHSHHGYIEDHQLPIPYQQLDNVNVSRVMTDGVHALQVLISQRAQLVPPKWFKDAYSADSAISEIYGELHDGNKAIMKALLTDEVLTKIKMV